MSVTTIPLADIDASAELNCRGEMKVIECVPLAQDIKSRGLLQAVIVRKFLPEDKGHYNWTLPYQLVAGFRRFTAHMILKRKEIECKIQDCTFDNARFLNLAENLQRQDLNILQEAKAIQKLLHVGYSQDDIGKELKQSRGWAQIRCKLLDLPPEIQLEAAAGLITQFHIRELSGLKTKEDQYEMVRKIKDAALKGRKLSKDDLRTKKAKPTEKRQRTKAEMHEMVDHIIDTMKGNFGTRCLAWATGEISSQDLYSDIKIQCDIQEIKYVQPM